MRPVCRTTITQIVKKYVRDTLIPTILSKNALTYTYIYIYVSAVIYYLGLCSFLSLQPKLNNHIKLIN